jgi:hypothetical protein
LGRLLVIEVPFLSRVALSGEYGAKRREYRILRWECQATFRAGYRRGRIGFFPMGQACPIV